MSGDAVTAGGLAVALPGADPKTDLPRIAADSLHHSAARCVIATADRIVVREDALAHGPTCACAPGNLMDPPFAPSPAEFQAWLGGFSSALVPQVDRPANGFVQGVPNWACTLADRRRDGTEDEALKAAWSQLHDAVMWVERELFRAGYYLSVGLSALTCTLCPTCDVTKLCKFPFRARPSMEAVGIDVEATLRAVELPGGPGVLTGLALAI